MTRTMAPTIAKLESMARTPSEISSTNRQAGYEEGKRHAYRVVRRWIVGLLLCGGIVTWVIG